PAVAKTHGLLFSGYNGTLCIELPSGRALCYREPEIMFGVDGFSIIMYAGMNKDGKWDIMQGNGAKFLRDIVQGLARDVLLDAMQRLSEANYSISLHQANKVIVESEEPAALMAISAIMEQPPHWAKEMRLTTQGYACNRYLEKKPRPSSR
ncbi:MAG: DNA polymerase, partial [Clostridia bacterium]|nr:DNA polymerase [Clostridia bacterium]